MERLARERDAAQSELNEKKAEVQNIFAKAKEFAEQANARVAEFEERAKNAEAEQSQLQASLGEANAELERLKNELQQTGAAPSAFSEPQSESTLGQ